MNAPPVPPSAPPPTPPPLHLMTMLRHSSLYTPMPIFSTSSRPLTSEAASASAGCVAVSSGCVEVSAGCVAVSAGCVAVSTGGVAVSMHINIMIRFCNYCTIRNNNIMEDEEHVI